MRTEKEIKRICTGISNILNTDWPIESFIVRVQESGRKRPYWRVTYNLCNGVPSGSKSFATRSEALAALDYIRRA